jgi:hypothetical protein
LAAGCHSGVEINQEKNMGRRNYLIEGVSGAGKTAVCTE